MSKRTFIIVISIIIVLAVAMTAFYFIRINNAGQEIERLAKQAEEQEQKLHDDEILKRNINKLLLTVYYGTAVPEGGGQEKDFTAFSMFYRDEYYLITAGHCVEYDGIKYTDFKFISNRNDFWITPHLAYYEADYENNRDFAIFNYRYIKIGLLPTEDDLEPRYVLGNMQRKLNFIKEFDSAIEGESGSPVLNSGCRLIGIVIKKNSDYTPISEVTGAIDDMLDD